MAQTAEFDSRIERLEAALAAASDALERSRADGPADRSEDLAAAEAALEAARTRIEALESQDDDRAAALQAAEARAEAAEDALAKAQASGTDGEADGGTDLGRQLHEIKAARAQDLAEMKALLAELEPLLETTDA